MLTFAVIILGASSVFLAHRLSVSKKRIREMGEAALDRKPLLVERRGGWFQMGALDRLQAHVNELILENRDRSRTEKGYLSQIQATLGSLREAVLIIDGENRIKLANEAFRQLLRTREQPLGQPLESVIQGADFFDYVSQVKGGGSSEFFMLEVSMGHHTLWFEITGTRLPEQEDPGGPLALFVLHDITHPKRLERIRTEFVANVSHELRTPVTVIKGFVDTLVEDGDVDPEERRRFLLKIQKNVSRLHEMLEDLLMLSRLESNPDAMKRERRSFSEVVREAAEAFQTRMEPDLNGLRLDFTQEEDVVLIDPLRISQVIENLLGNALRHAKGFSQITVRTRIVGAGVVCEVSDDGVGIPPKDLPHVFQRFYRVDKGRSRESGGTGLGLSIVKHIVQQHGGEVAAESVIGEGTTMRFSIPFPDALAERAVLSFVRDRAKAGRASVRALASERE